MSAIDDAAEALGIELFPWQREIGQRVLDGERVVLVGGRRGGRTVLRRVIAKAEELNPQTPVGVSVAGLPATATAPAGHNQEGQQP